MMDKHKTIAFIGAGNMARAMITGLLQNGFQSEHIWASSPNVQKHEHLKKTHGIHATPDNLEAAAQADVIVLAIKPYIIQSTWAEIKTIIHPKKTFINFDCHWRENREYCALD